MGGGASLTGYVGVSEEYAAEAAAAGVVKEIESDSKAMINCSALREGEYDEKDRCIGVPCILGKNDIEEIMKIELNAEEKELFAKSAKAVHATNADLHC